MLPSLNLKKLITSKLFILFSLFSLLLSSVVVSYTEELQVKLLMPLRDLIKTPNVKLGELPKNNSSNFFHYKSSDEGYYINPWMTAQTVLREAYMVINNGCKVLDINEKSNLFIAADYFIINAKSRNFKNLEFFVWEYPINYTYGLKPGWISAPAQAEIAIVLAATSKCSEDKKYLEGAKKAIDSFRVDVVNGGVLANLRGFVWYEEYSQAGIEPPLVFNGHVNAVLAMESLIDFHPLAKSIYSEGLKSIQENIHVYDNGWWSWYDSKGEPANNIYQQKLHVRLLAVIYNKTADPLILSYYNKFYWQSFNPFSSLQRLLIRPSRFLSLLIILNYIFFMLFNIFIYFILLRIIGFENDFKK